MSVRQLAIYDNMPSKILSNKYQGREYFFQKEVARYLDMIGSFWFHCPNEGNRHIVTAMMFKRQGLKSGVPDIMILDQRHGKAGFAIELKVGNNKPSENQIEFMKELQKRNWETLIAYSLDEVLDRVQQYYKGNPPNL